MVDGVHGVHGTIVQYLVVVELTVELASATALRQNTVVMIVLRC